ncbi:MAG TPA: alpha/beta fold hydrolase [Dehalococcoidia bacterium]|nr:alpha/beta fold hydrolase [Dehalococcoidia bacterium]
MPAVQNRVYIEPEAAGEVRLEAVLHLPESATAAVAVCHPHPQYGGDMDNYVVTALCEALTGAGVAALRFNFRGTGTSEGVHEDGEGEVRDLASALRWLKNDRQFARVAACGYSFGAHVANRAQDVAAIACISPANPLVATEAPLLVAIGDRDQFMPVERLQGFVEQHDNVTLEVSATDDHFWPAGLATMAARASEFLAEHLEREQVNG